jgi:hypothetical protein
LAVPKAPPALNAGLAAGFFIWPVNSSVRAVRAALGTLSLAWALGLAGTAARAESLVFCDATPERSAAAQAQLLSFSATVARELAASGAPAALISRDGLDLSTLGRRYSHAGIALREHPDGAWTVRQLYFACEEGRPRLFDQGLAGFAGGTRRPERGFVRVLLLPEAAAQALAQTASDKARALALLHPRYSANAHAFGLAFQNCNQWVAELMAAAWGQAADRASAQQWLRQHGFEADWVNAHARVLLWLMSLSPLLHLSDHPEAHLAQAQLQVVLPQGLEHWLRGRYPELQTLEFCHDGGQMVWRRQGPPFGEHCQAEAGDHTLALH